MESSIESLTPTAPPPPTPQPPPPPPPPPPQTQQQPSQQTFTYFRKEPEKGVSYGSVHIARRDINSLNFDYPFASKVILKEELENSPKKELRHLYIKWAALLLIAIIVALAYLVLQISVAELMAVKINLLSDLMKNNGEGVAVAYWWGFNLVTALLSGALVIFLQETAEGSGSPEILGFLNGVDVPSLCTFLSFIVRYISTFFMVMSNLPGGLQEPYLPIGLILGGLMYRLGVKRWKPFYAFEWDYDRRNLAAAGLACSAASVFGTPLGGLIFAMEHLSHWRGDILFTFMATGTLSSFITTTTYYYYRAYKDGEGHPVDIFSPHRENTKFVDFSEIPLFIAIGLAGAALGTIWNVLQRFLLIFRRRFIQKKWLRLIEIVLVSSFISLSGFGAFILLDSSDNCVSKSLLEAEKSRIVENFNIKCSNKTYAGLSIFLFQEPRYIIRALLTLPEDQLTSMVLSVFLALFFVWSLLHAGTFMPSGILLPNIIIGAVWGRLLSILFHTDSFTFIKEPYKDATKLAYLCGVAQASGATRMSLGLTIIMVEASGSINFIVPVAVIVVVSRFLSSIVTPSIIKTIAYYKGYVILGHTPIPLCADLTVQEIMCKKMACMPTTARADFVQQFLEVHHHLEFPVTDWVSTTTVEGPINFKGMILRKQLLALIDPPEKGRKRSVLFLKSLKSDVKMTVAPSTEINIEEHMNPTPFYIYKTASITRVSTLFISMALHTLIVVEPNNLQAVGLVTRKDLALNRKEFSMWRVKIVKEKTAFT